MTTRSACRAGATERVVIEGRDLATGCCLSQGRQSLWQEPFRSTEHGDLLYGEDGLPK